MVCLYFWSNFAHLKLTLMCLKCLGVTCWCIRLNLQAHNLKPYCVIVRGQGWAVLLVLIQFVTHLEFMEKWQSQMASQTFPKISNRGVRWAMALFGTISSGDCRMLRVKIGRSGRNYRYLGRSCHLWMLWPMICRCCQWQWQNYWNSTFTTSSHLISGCNLVCYGFCSH